MNLKSMFMQLLGKNVFVQESTHDIKYILPCGRLTIDWFWIDDRIYWTL
jgi:hypothetical protein